MIDMLNIPYSDMDWVEALRRITGKGYRKTKNGRYETFASVQSKTISLGTYDTIAEWSRILNINYATLWSKINRGDFKDFEKVPMENSHV